MSLHFDYPGEMQRHALDADTADRLLAGHVDPEDAPPGYSRLAAFLRAPWTADADLDPRFVAVLAGTVRSAPVPKARPSMGLIMPRIKLAAVLATIALVGTTGLAFAGSLPGAAQDIASTMLAKAGVTVPGPNSNAKDHPSTRGPSTEKPGATPTSNGKGSEISDIARSDLRGLDKGAAVSTAASDGKSRAGQDHSAPVATPNPGGTGTADTASQGHSTKGTAKADEASGGHSSAGSANSEAGQSHRP